MSLNLEDFKRISEKERNSVFGYIRRIEIDHVIEIPMIVYQICALFCMIYDEWDRKYSPDTYIITDQTNIKRTPEFSITTAFLTNVVNEGIHCWKFEIIEFTRPGRDSFRFGIVMNDENKIKEVSDYWFGATPNTAYVWDSGYNSALMEHKYNSWGKKYGRKCVKGDIVLIHLDFNELALSFGINDEKFDVAYTIKSEEKYRVAIQMEGANDELELISYQQNIPWDGSRTIVKHEDNVLSI